MVSGGIIIFTFRILISGKINLHGQVQREDTTYYTFFVQFFLLDLDKKAHKDKLGFLQRHLSL